MSQNVAEAVAGRNLTLFEKMASNESLANVIMALIGRLVIMAHQSGKPIEGIALEPPVWLGRQARSRITFNTLSITRSPFGLWSPADDLQKYCASKSAHLAKVFDKNQGVKIFFSKLISEIENFCDHKRIAWKDLKVEKAFITPENTLVLKFSKEHVGLWER